jgi:predicted TIM-barrel fold metal-dependent hydrolase
MSSLRIVSADSHFTEPRDLWVERIDQRFRDRAPRVVKDEKRPGQENFVAPGLPPAPVAFGFAAGKGGEELRQTVRRGYDAARPSGWDPAERLKDQDVDGILAEVIYTTFGMSLFGLEDGQLQQACFKTFNDWAAEFVSHDRRRLYAIGLIPHGNVEESVGELQRVAKLGLSGALICGAPTDEPYHSKTYDPLWAAAQDLRIPLSLHVITGGPRRGENPRLVASGRHLGPARRTMNITHEIQSTLTDIIFGGVLERFPRLLLVSAENDTGWLPHYMHRLDHAYEKFNVMLDEPLPMKPSHYVRRQLVATFQDDPVGAYTHKLFGEESYMWASDFPHTDSTWPNSHDVIERDFAGIDEAIKRKIVFDNAVRVYGMKLD